MMSDAVLWTLIYVAVFLVSIVLLVGVAMWFAGWLLAKIFDRINRG